MAVSPTPVFVQTPKCTVTNYSSAQAAAAFVTIYTGAADCSKVVAVNVTASCTESHVLQLAITRNSTSYILGSMLVNNTSGAGVDGNYAAIDMLRGGPVGFITGLPYDNDGQKYIFLTSVDTLQINSVTSFTNSRKMDIICFGADF